MISLTCDEFCLRHLAASRFTELTNIKLTIQDGGHENNKLLKEEHLCLFGGALEWTEKCPVDIEGLGTIYLPCFVHHVCSFLKQHSGVEGIFRIPGSKLRINLLKEKLENGHLLEHENPHDVANILQLYFRELPFGLFPHFMHDAIMQLMSLSADKNVDTTEMIQLLCLVLPRCHLHCLVYIIDFLFEVSLKANKNLMTSSNLAKLFAPNLIKLDDSKFNEQNVADLTKRRNQFVDLLITNHSDIGLLSPSLDESQLCKDGECSHCIVVEGRHKRRRSIAQRMMRVCGKALRAQTIHKSNHHDLEKHACVKRTSAVEMDNARPAKRKSLQGAGNTELTTHQTQMQLPEITITPYPFPDDTNHPTINFTSDKSLNPTHKHQRHVLDKIPCIATKKRSKLRRSFQNTFRNKNSSDQQENSGKRQPVGRDDTRDLTGQRLANHSCESLTDVGEEKRKNKNFLSKLKSPFVSPGTKRARKGRTKSDAFTRKLRDHNEQWNVSKHDDKFKSCETLQSTISDTTSEEKTFDESGDNLLTASVYHQESSAPGAEQTTTTSSSSSDLLNESDGISIFDLSLDTLISRNKPLAANSQEEDKEDEEHLPPSPIRRDSPHNGSVLSEPRSFSGYLDPPARSVCEAESSERRLESSYEVLEERMSTRSQSSCASLQTRETSLSSLNSRDMTTESSGFMIVERFPSPPPMMRVDCDADMTAASDPGARTDFTGELFSNRSVENMSMESTASLNRFSRETLTSDRHNFDSIASKIDSFLQSSENLGSESNFTHAKPSTSQITCENVNDNGLDSITPMQESHFDSALFQNQSALCNDGEIESVSGISGQIAVVATTAGAISGDVTSLVESSKPLTHEKEPEGIDAPEGEELRFEQNIISHDVLTKGPMTERVVMEAFQTAEKKSSEINVLTQTDDENTATTSNLVLLQTESEPVTNLVKKCAKMETQTANTYKETSERASCVEKTNNASEISKSCDLNDEVIKRECKATLDSIIFQVVRSENPVLRRVVLRHHPIMSPLKRSRVISRRSGIKLLEECSIVRGESPLHRVTKSPGRKRVVKRINSPGRQMMRRTPLSVNPRPKLRVLCKDQILPDKMQLRSHSKTPTGSASGLLLSRSQSAGKQPRVFTSIAASQRIKDFERRKRDPGNLTSRKNPPKVKPGKVSKVIEQFNQLNQCKLSPLPYKDNTATETHSPYTLAKSRQAKENAADVITSDVRPRRKTVERLTACVRTPPRVSRSPLVIRNLNVGDQLDFSPIRKATPTQPRSRDPVKPISK